MEWSNDKRLNINTVGIQDVRHPNAHYNRYEATPYFALETLCESFSFEDNRNVVDFGCGKGRLSFYLHERLGISTTGIEMNEALWKKALENVQSYRTVHAYTEGSIQFIRGIAEEYSIQKSDCVFYFFNPFSIQIFMKVLNNIQQSVMNYEREVHIILYYPTAEYIQYIESKTSLEYVQEIRIPTLYDKNENERFVIYRFEG